MEYKKIIIISILLFIFSVAAVSATDFDNIQTKDIEDSDEGVVQDSLQQDVVESTVINRDLNADFDDLQLLILTTNEGSTLDLTCDYVSGGYGVNINKNIVINGNRHILNAKGISNIFILNSPVSVTFKDITFANGKGDMGSAIFSECESTSITLIDCNFISNEANKKGGAVYTTGGNLNVKDCTFTSNAADYSGGAIFFEGSGLVIENSIFDNNFADEVGGAIYCGSAYNLFEIKNSKFKSNLVDDSSGGAIYSKNKLTVENSVFESNSANNHGGAIYCDNIVTANNCSFYNNVANGDFFIQCSGGAIYSTGDVNIVRSEFIENRALDYGGAIRAKNVNINIGQKNDQSFNSIFYSNWVMNNDGGAIYADNVKAVNTKFDSNYAHADGGAIFCEETVDVDYCIFEYNNYVIIEDYDVYHDLKFGGSGGAIFTKNEAIINNSTFFMNYALNEGGAIHAKSVSLKNSPSYFIFNNALKSHGGAIYTDKFNNNVKYAVFDGNRAGEYAFLDFYRFRGDGGSIYINGENDIEFSSCLFMNSHANDEGGVIYLDSTSSKLTLINNIFRNNEANADGRVVFNKGQYGTVKNNWWGNDAYIFKNVLVEWKAFSSNENHFDENPLSVRLILGSTNAGIDSRIPCSIQFVSLLDNSINHELYGLDYFHFKTPKRYDGNFVDYNYYANGFTAVYLPNNLGIQEIFEDCYEYDEKLSGYINIVNGSDMDSVEQVIQTTDLYFIHLQNMINTASDGSFISLYNNFVYNELNDEEGIIVNKNIVIDGQGHILDAKSLSGILQSEMGFVTLKNIVFRNGYQVSADDGGAVRILGDAKFTIINCTFDSNKALQDGGAIYNEGGNLELRDCTFVNNRCEGANKLNDCDGGAVHSKAHLLIDHCVFNNNYAADNGGAIYATGGISWVSTPSRFESNTAYKGKGGAVYTNAFNNDVKYAVFFNNKAGEGATVSDDGGAIYINNANTVTFSQCAFIINHCTDEGGAIYLDSSGSHLTLRNNYFLGNTADDEGQIVFNKGHYDIITDNWWADNLPSKDNDLLIEWEPILANDHHVDSHPLYMKLKLTSNVCNVGNSVWATLCFYHYGDGSLCNGEMYTDLIGFLPTGNVELYNRMDNEYYINILVMPLKSGVYTITANLYGQFASATLSVYENSQLPNSNPSNESKHPVSDEDYNADIPNGDINENKENDGTLNLVFYSLFKDKGNAVNEISEDNYDANIQSGNNSVTKTFDIPKTNSGDNNIWWIILTILAIIVFGGLIWKYKK